MHEIIHDDIEHIINSNLPWEKLYRKNILISGANGYVPAYFIHTFLHLNDINDAQITVYALCRNKEKAEKRFADYLERDDFRIVIQDVCQEIKINDQIHIYIHAASPAGIHSRYENPVNTFLANVKGCENMLNSAIQNPCEYFLLLSSIDIYGKSNTLGRWKEDDCGFLDSMNPRNLYANGKRAAESLCIAYHEKYHIPVYVARPAQIVGPGPELNDGRLHIDFISHIKKGNQIILKSDGTALRSFMYISDAVIAMLTVLFKGTDGEAYNIADETGECSVRELAELMAYNTTQKEVNVVFDITQRNKIEVTAAPAVATLDSSKLRHLGFSPSISLKKGTKRMMLYYGIE